MNYSGTVRVSVCVSRMNVHTYICERLISISISGFLFLRGNLAVLLEHQVQTANNYVANNNVHT